MLPIPASPLPETFGSASKVLKASSTLLRIMQLNTAIDPEERQYFIADLRKLWLTAQEELSGSLYTAKQNMINKLPRLDLADVYGPALTNAKTPDELNKCILRFMKDVDCVITNPLRKSTRGQKGPTFLVSYPRLNTKLEEFKHKTQVIKWTQWNELCCTRIYTVLSDFISEIDDSSNFLVPAVCGFDFERGVHDMSDATLCTMQIEESEAIMKTFNKIAKIGAPGHQLPDKLVMLCERINGENLFDFAVSKYKLLPHEEKMKLLTKLGQIAMLDLLFGNLDRLIQIWFNPKQNAYTLLDCEANLGNIMVRWVVDEGKSPMIYAIDNGAQTELVEEPERIQQYQTFLRELFANPEMENLLVRNMVESFKHALSTQLEDLSSSQAWELREQLENFSDDIEKFGGECFHKGLKEMSSKLHDAILPMWNGDKGAPWKTYLLKTYPKLLDAIQLRFNEFTTKRLA